MFLFYVFQLWRRETLPSLKGKDAPSTFSQMWEGFDPRAEELEVETLKEWEQEDVVLRVIRYRIGIFKRTKSDDGRHLWFS